MSLCIVLIFLRIGTENILQKLGEGGLVHKVPLAGELYYIGRELLGDYFELLLRDEGVVVAVHERDVLLIALDLAPLPRLVEVAALLLQLVAEVGGARA